MAVLATGTRGVMGVAITTLVQTGAGAANIKFETSADAEVACLNLNATSFTGASGVLTAGAISDDAHAAGGTIEHVSLYNKNADKVAEFTCATSAAEFTISSLSIGAGDTIGCSSFTITVPAS